MERRALCLTSLCLFALFTLAASHPAESVATNQLKGIRQEVHDLRQEVTRIDARIDRITKANAEVAAENAENFNRTLYNSVSKVVSERLNDTKAKLKQVAPLLRALHGMEPRLEKMLENRLEVKLKKMVEEQAGEGD